MVCWNPLGFGLASPLTKYFDTSMRLVAPMSAISSEFTTEIELATFFSSCTVRIPEVVCIDW